MTSQWTLVRKWLNLVGGATILFSLALPWRVLNGTSMSIIDSLKPDIRIVLLVTSLIAVAGLVSFLTRFGGLLAIGGIILYSMALPINPGGIPSMQSSQYATGLCIAMVGGAVSLVGESRNYQFIIAHLPSRPK